MTSKEAFKRIVEIYGNTGSLEGTYNDFLTIKKDLEVLAILKKYFRITAEDMRCKKLLSIVSRADYEEVEGIDVTACADILEISEFKIIKEWLENERKYEIQKKTSSNRSNSMDR